MYLSTDEFQEMENNHLYNDTEEAYMTEIQLRRIVDRNAMEGSDQQSDGDERMTKDGENISKFSKEAMTLGDDVYTCTSKESRILEKVYALYDYYVGDDRVFSVKNGAPRIMTKYKDTPTLTSSNPSTPQETRSFLV
jgi:hypothetical protein